jgi:hypothetical protein
MLNQAHYYIINIIMYYCIQIMQNNNGIKYVLVYGDKMSIARINPYTYLDNSEYRIIFNSNIFS